MAPDGRRVAAICGIRPVTEALRAQRRRVLRIAVPPGKDSAGLRELAALAAQQGVPLHRDPSAREVEAEAEPYPELGFEELLSGPAPRWLVALDGVTDVGNLGAIARTAEVAGVSGLVLEYRRAPPIGPGALRASAGALEHLKVGRTPNLRKALELARREGLKVLVAEPGAPPLAQIPLELLLGELVVVLGSESEGTRGGIQAIADARMGIPLQGRIGSLGVAAAGAYLLLRLAELRGTTSSVALATDARKA